VRRRRPLNITKLKMRTAKATTRGRVTAKGDFLTHPPRDAFRAVPDGPTHPDSRSA
jgi:hypothetical protein